MSETIYSILKNNEVSLYFPKITAKRHTITRIKKSPCQTACPIDTRVKSYIGLIAAGEFEKAVEVVKRNNPFPGVCGRVCIHPCENECRRGNIDEPLAICYLKRFLADYEFRHGRIRAGKVQRKKKKQIAIVGSGPAGLTAANNLARSGYGITVFEASSEPGGLLIDGISSFILPKEIVRFEIEGIKEWGVDIRTNTRIGIDISLKVLQREYDAILFAIGAHKALRPNIPGSPESDGIVNFIDFLKMVNHEETFGSGKTIAIVGGDRVSVDMARSALRVGFDQAIIIYSRSREEMPVQEHHIMAAEAEGVSIHFQTSPLRIIEKKGKVAGIECVKTEPVYSRISRKKPAQITDSNFIIRADRIASTINREPDFSNLETGEVFNRSIMNTFSVDPLSLSTNIKGIFAAGDCATGPKTTIEAIASGQKAALSIEAYLRGISMDRIVQERQPMEYEVKSEYGRQEAKVKMQVLPASERNSFREVELGFSEHEAMEEARRCIKCGPCIECDICNPECDKRLTLLSPKDVSEGILLRVQHNVFPLNGNILECQLVQDNLPTFPVVMTSLKAEVNAELCRGCGDCVTVCHYDAPRLKKLDTVYVSDIMPDLCRGCGICLSVCESTAITVSWFNDTQINDLAMTSLAENKILVFVCNWSYEITADLMQISDLKMIRVLCASRIGSAQILKAFEQGANGVLGIGCHENACHYNAVPEATGHYRVAKKIIRTLGQDPDRIRFERLPPDEPDKIYKVVRSFCKKIEDLKQ